MLPLRGIRRLRPTSPVHNRLLPHSPLPWCFKYVYLCNLCLVRILRHPKTEGSIIMKFKAPVLVALILTVALLGHPRARVTDDSSRIAGFEAQLESIRQELKIPAYSAAIVKDQKVIWAKGFGYADV